MHTSFVPTVLQIQPFCFFECFPTTARCVLKDGVVVSRKKNNAAPPGPGSQNELGSRSIADQRASGTRKPRVPNRNPLSPLAAAAASSSTFSHISHLPIHPAHACPPQPKSPRAAGRRRRGSRRRRFPPIRPLPGLPIRS